ncbi:MAG: hypothetical protein JWR56_509 [Massilia sp.]|jgi:hypothetical protein|nr:hypothetical protein [Massilia sp.]
MTLRERLIALVRSGELGNDGIFTRQEFMHEFRDWNPKTTGCFLSNSEMRTGRVHSPTYLHFTERVARGVYRLHPNA